MGTFTIDLLSGDQYLFNGDFAGSGGTVTTAGNGLNKSASQIRLGGTLSQPTVITDGRVATGRTGGGGTRIGGTGGSGIVIVSYQI